MSIDMLGKLVRKIVELPAEMLGTLFDLCEKLTGSEGPEWFKALKRFLRKESQWESALTNLKLIASDIAIATGTFTKDSFFKNGPAELHFDSIFEQWVLPAIPEDIPAWSGALRLYEFEDYMFSSEILSELDQPKLFSPPEFAAIAKGLISGQFRRGIGLLLPTDGSDTIFHVRLNNEHVAAVSVNHGLDSYWLLRADVLVTRCRGDKLWRGGFCVFSCSSSTAVRTS